MDLAAGWTYARSMWRVPLIRTATATAVVAAVACGALALPAEAKAPTYTGPFATGGGFVTVKTKTLKRRSGKVNVVSFIAWTSAYLCHPFGGPDYEKTVTIRISNLRELISKGKFRTLEIGRDTNGDGSEDTFASVEGKVTKKKVTGTVYSWFEDPSDSPDYATCELGGPPPVGGSKESAGIAFTAKR